MNLFVNDEAENWQKVLWLQIVNSPRVTGMQYIDLMGQHFVSRIEYMVQSTAFAEEEFVARMPFSWLIYETIDEYLQKTIEEAQLKGEGMDIMFFILYYVCCSFTLGCIFFKV